jgi:hypothetical protein
MHYVQRSEFLLEHSAYLRIGLGNIDESDKFFGV